MANTASETLRERATGYAGDAETNLKLITPETHISLAQAVSSVAQVQATLAVFTALERIANALEADRG